MNPPAIATARQTVWAEIWWALGGGLLWTLAMVAVPPTPFEGLDFPRICEPYVRFFRTSILQGELPWWNPYASLGRPFLADLQTASFYPATYLSVLFGVTGGWIVATTVHGVLAIFGFTRLMNWLGVPRAVAGFGGVIFLFSAPLLARMQAGQVNYVYSLCYLPMVLWLAGRFATEPTRRRWAALAFTWGLQLLCCHPQVFWLSAVGAGLFVTGWLMQPPWGAALRAWIRAALGMITACGCGMALIGFVLVPFAELIGQSNRAAPSLAFSAAFAMTPDHWMSLISPARGVFGINWEYDTHAGVVALIGGMVALLRWRDPAMRGVALMVLVSLVIMAGDTTPLFALLYKVVPGLSSFRVPARAGGLVVLGLVMGAAVLAGTPVRERRTRVRVWLAGLAVGTVVWVYFTQRMSPGPGAARWFLSQLAWVGAATLAWYFWLERERGGRSPVAWIGRLLLPAVLVGELVMAVTGLKHLPGRSAQFPAESVVVKAIHARGLDHQIAPVRVCLPPTLLRENSGMIYHYATPMGFESLSLGRVWTYLHLAVGANPVHAYNTTPDGKVYTDAPRLNSLNLTVSLPADSGVLTIKPDPDPRAYVVVRSTVVADANAAMARMTAGHSFHDDAVVEQTFSPGLIGGPAPGRSSAKITQFSLNALEVEVDASSPGLLVLAEAWYPGWHASIDGHEVPCVPANGWMRGVPVPIGHSLVRLAYRQNGLLAGTAISLLAAAVLIWAWRSRVVVAAGAAI